jgi:alpha-ribazole phosphatase
MHIYLVRHPPPIDADGLCYGHLDVAVDEPAIARTVDSVVTQMSSQTLASAHIYCSPSSRCWGLARRLASPREPTVVEDLVEMNFGDWQGIRWDAIAREKIDAWTNDVWGYRPGGGESANMVATRWERWVYHLRQNDGGNVVAVTHAGVIRVALACSDPVNGFSWLEAHIPFGSVHRLDLE